MIKNYIETVTIIDNTENEVSDLKKVFESKQILYEHFHPKKFNNISFKLKNRKLIFLDLYLDDTTTQNAASQISSIRNYFKKIIGKNFGTYGIVLWTKHLDEIENFKEKISQDFIHYTLPIFVVGLDKTKYLTHGFSNIFKDIEKILFNNTASCFFINWDNAIQKSKSKVIQDIFSLIDNYKYQDSNLKYLLYNLARNQTGINSSNLQGYPLYLDAYKAFSELLNYEISSNNIKGYKPDIFSDLNSIKYNLEDGTDIITKSFDATYSINGIQGASKQKQKLINDTITLKFNKTNSCLLIEQQINHKHIIPGNIYEIIKTDDDFISNECNTNNQQGGNDIPIIMEITPPCDFSNKKNSHPKVLGGFIADFDKNRINNELKGDSFYTEIYPLELEDIPKMMVFDFKHIGIINEKKLKSSRYYKLKYRAKDKLFADILQKLSSHVARLGLSVLH